jgi:hypothetical protein
MVRVSPDWVARSGHYTVQDVIRIARQALGPDGPEGEVAGKVAQQPVYDEGTRS